MRVITQADASELGIAGRDAVHRAKRFLLGWAAP
jgi:hypothetical protein